MSIGENIKRYRVLKNVSRKDLAEELGVAESTISRYESGKREPSIDVLSKVTDILEVSFDELVGKPIKSDNLIINKNSNIGDNIRRIRKYKKLTLKELGEGVGLSEQAIGQYERGDREPSIKKLIEIAFALGVELNELCGEKPNELSIGEKIKFYRTNSNLTQKQLAEKCSLSESAIKYYESNRRNPKIETLDKISKALNMPINKDIEYKELKDYTIDELLAEIKRRVKSE